MKTITVFCTLLTFLCCFTFVDSTAQSSSRSADAYLSLPAVFKLGEHTSHYDGVRSDYSSLLEVCDDDMKAAHGKLYSMMKEMEAFADVMDYDLEGVKAWMHFFFEKDGSIDHIGFHLKPNSKNIDLAEFRTFLKNFSKEYQFPLVAEKGYAHYSTFSFPIF